MKKNLIFLHGFLGSKQDWKIYLNYFNKKYNCIALDLPGHGKSTSFSLSKILKLIPYQSHIISYSMGGRITLKLIKENPDHFTSAILMSTNPGINSKKEKQIRLKKERYWINLLKTNELNTFLSKWYSQELFKEMPIPQYRKNQNKKLLIKALRKLTIAKQKPFWPHLNSFKTPILFLFGEEDKKYVTIHDKIKSLETHIQSKLIPKCTHGIHLENPSLCINEIEKYHNEFKAL